MLQAINKKHQTKVNRAVYWITKYSHLNNLRDIADGNGEEKEYKKYDRLCARSFDKYLDYLYELPKREQKQIEKNF